MDEAACPGCRALQRRVAEMAIRFGVILREVWAGARALSVLMSVWRTC